tara:strand:+ start:2953 stop:3906 length:954 start_codon:yes stop_codon:yes gene_type:complete
MAYTAGDTILDDEYNAFVGNATSPFGYNHFAGTGALQYGLNQSSISTVSAGGTVQASQWNSLFTGLDNIANHTNVSITASSVSAGDTVAIRSALITDLANLAAAVAGGSTSATALSDRDAGTSTNSGTWNSTSTIERSITFANNATMRAFFNAGGTIKINPGTSGSVSGNKDTVFQELEAAMGTVEFKAHATTRSGSGETQTSFASSTGFYDLSSNSYASLLKLTSNNSGYTSNTLEISVKIDAAPASATVITVKQVALDPAADTTYTSGNTSGVAANPNEAPAMSLNLVAKEPTAAQGLAAAIQYTSNAQVSNSQS